MSDDVPGERAAMLERLNQAFSDFVPHNRALGIHFVDYGPGVAQLALPYRAELAGNPETGVLHGGVLSSLLDATCGASVFMKMPVPTHIATLDLRIDYLKPATPHRDVVARATCFKLTKNVGFVRATAFHDDESDPIAAAAGAFMIATGGAARGGA